MSLWVPSVYSFKKMGVIYYAISSSHSPPLESKTDFQDLQILNILPVNDFPQVLVSSLEQSGLKQKYHGIDAQFYV